MDSIKMIKIALYGLNGLTPEQKQHATREQKQQIARLHLDMQDELNDFKWGKMERFYSSLAKFADSNFKPENPNKTNRVSAFLRLDPRSLPDDGGSLKCTATFKQLGVNTHDVEKYLRSRGFSDFKLD